MMKAILFLLIVIGIAFAPLNCVSNSTQIIVQEQGGNIAVAIMLVILVIVCAYSIGSIISKAEYIVFAKDELYHLGFSVILLIGFSGILLLSCTTTDFFFGSTFQSLGTLQSGC
ncbi:hypothetical protein HZC07_01600, partial [Candidatus Micrarchaeota archaeon]|nr:hypothetical protein [Candidatus Micrarchaeota archaeon]